MPDETPHQPDEPLDETLDGSNAGTDDEATLQPSHPAEWPFEGLEAPPKTIGQYRIIGIIGNVERNELWTLHTSSSFGKCFVFQCFLFYFLFGE